MIWGKTNKEKAEIQTKLQKESEADGRNWYAWFPVMLYDGRWIWRERVWREFWWSSITTGCHGYSYYLSKTEMEAKI